MSLILHIYNHHHQKNSNYFRFYILFLMFVFFNFSTVVLISWSHITFFSWNDFFSALIYDCYWNYKCCSYKANKNLHNLVFSFFWEILTIVFFSNQCIFVFYKIYCIYWAIKCILYKSIWGTVTHCNLLKPHSCLFWAWGNNPSLIFTYWLCHNIMKFSNPFYVNGHLICQQMQQFLKMLSYMKICLP